MATEYQAEIDALRKIFHQIEMVTNPDELKATIARLTEESSAPDLWDDPDKAQEVTSKLSHVQSELDRVVGLGERISDLEAMLEMAQEESEGDPELAAELFADLDKDLERTSKELDDLQIRTLLSGKYDERDAVVTIRSGAGGVDAADFAQMLQRMYLRWAERKGYSAKVLDTLATALNQVQAKSMEIRGHTDAKGSDPYNQALSERRAQAVLTALRQRQAAPGANARGYGESQPVAPNELDGHDNPAGRQLNRRVEIFVRT